MITLEQLTSITGKPELSARLLQSLNDTLIKYSINTPLRMCHFLAQVLHESGNLHYFQEIASGEAYENRKDLGNIYQGDGKLYKGRGLIQITGRANYTAISKDLKVDFVKWPNQLALEKWAVISAGWFWNKRKLNEHADRDDLAAITRRVNGGFNGYAERKNWLLKCKSIIK